jgi:hypothetical protein
MTQTQEPIRAIFVGKTAPLPALFPGITELRYGLTGVVKPTFIEDFLYFYPDGHNEWWTCERSELYVPSLDKTRHCPKI